MTLSASGSAPRSPGKEIRATSSCSPRHSGWMRAANRAPPWRTRPTGAPVRSWRAPVGQGQRSGVQVLHDALGFRCDRSAGHRLRVEGAVPCGVTTYTSCLGPIETRGAVLAAQASSTIGLRVPAPAEPLWTLSAIAISRAAGRHGGARAGRWSASGSTQSRVQARLRGRLLSRPPSPSSTRQYERRAGAWE